jgi:hypothetical protein
VSPRQSPLENHLEAVGIKAITIRLPKLGKVRKLGKNFGNEKNKFVRKIIELQPDVFFFMKDEHISPKMIQAIRKRSPKTKIIMWYGDQRGYRVPSLLQKRAGLLDALLITNDDPKQRKIYRQKVCKQICTFYHSFDPQEFQEWPWTITHDVFFGGSNFRGEKFPLSPFRRQFINSVKNNFSLVVHGGGWSFPTEKWLMRPDYAKHLRKAFINLGINHYNIFRYYNRRLFECVASGRLHITHYIPGMEHNFRNHEHLVWFKTADEGIKQIRYYMQHSKIREKVAATGRQFMLERHSWAQRVKQLRNILDRIL